MATVLLKKLIIERHPLNFFTVLACVTLSSKYQDSSVEFIDYELILQFYHIENIEQIHVSLLLYLSFPSLQYHLIIGC